MLFRFHPVHRINAIIMQGTIPKYKGLIRPVAPSETARWPW